MRKNSLLPCVGSLAGSDFIITPYLRAKKAKRDVNCRGSLRDSRYRLAVDLLRSRELTKPYRNSGTNSIPVGKPLQERSQAMEFRYQRGVHRRLGPVRRGAGRDGGFFHQLCALSAAARHRSQSAGLQLLRILREAARRGRSRSRAELAMARRPLSHLPRADRHRHSGHRGCFHRNRSRAVLVAGHASLSGFAAGRRFNDLLCPPAPARNQKVPSPPNPISPQSRGIGRSGCSTSGEMGHDGGGIFVSEYRARDRSRN